MSLIPISSTAGDSREAGNEERLLTPLLPAVAGVDFFAGDLDGAPGFGEVAVDGVDVADDEFELHATGGFERGVDVGAPGVFAQLHIDAEQVRVGLARVDDISVAEAFADDGLVAPAVHRDF